MSGGITITKNAKSVQSRRDGDNMSENLIDSVEKDMAVLADPNASMEEKRYAKTDLMLSRRLIAKGVTELSDGAGA